MRTNCASERLTHVVDYLQERRLAHHQINRREHFDTKSAGSPRPPRGDGRYTCVHATLAPPDSPVPFPSGWIPLDIHAGMPHFG